ncbi:MAG: fibrillarin-like rRNA/tRNA 2'-O-methyltransferase [Candidatus Bathyarchaeia archaeon]
MTAVEEIFPQVFEIRLGDRRILATLNLTPGRSFYGEEIIRLGGREYRSWNPYRSKLAAAMLKGMRTMPISPGSRVLYLGVASGTTCSHISDIVGAEGHVWGVDFAHRPLRDLVDNLARYRRNVSPILGDARRPDSYAAMLPTVDVVYADVAQPDQSKIVADNAELYLEPGGWAMMAIKSRSVDVTQRPRRIYDAQVEVLKGRGFEVVEVVELEPYEKDHAMAAARYRT